MIVQVGNTAWAGCSSSESMLNFRLELLRQAMAERRRLKDSRARSQAIATQYGSFSRYVQLNGPYSPKGKKWRPRAPDGIMPR